MPTIGSQKCLPSMSFVISLHLQDGETVVDYKPLEDTVDPSNMLCACKVCLDLFGHIKPNMCKRRICGTYESFFRIVNS